MQFNKYCGQILNVIVQMTCDYCFVKYAKKKLLLISIFYSFIINKFFFLVQYNYEIFFIQVYIDSFVKIIQNTLKEVNIFFYILEFSVKIAIKT